MAEIREGIKGYQEQISAFIEEHRPLLEDPESGHSTLSRIYTQGADVLTAATDEDVRVANETTKAANLLTAAINDPHCSAGKVANKEKAYNRLSQENTVMQATFTELGDFLAEVKARLDAEYEEGGRPKNIERHPVQSFSLSDTPKKTAWWKRLLGIHQETPSAPRESPTTLSPLESDPEDYQMLLDHYEKLVKELRDLFRTRDKHPVAYDIKPDLPERWQETYETLTNKMAWCDRNMDAIEERNAEVAGSELATRRKNLASRRGELGE